jgi:hypothetical protein
MRNRRPPRPRDMRQEPEPGVVLDDLPARLRKWAHARDRLALDASLLYTAANEIESLRRQVKS